MACLTVIEKQDNTIACVASTLAAETYQLKILAKNIQNDLDNKTRFLVFSTTTDKVNDKEGKSITSVLIEFDTQHKRGLVDMMVQLAKHRLNVRKVEAYGTDKNFKSNLFYLEIEADMYDESFIKAYAYMRETARAVRVLGCYKSLI